MCGIIGYTGSQPAAPLVFRCLRSLEYRGYDSAGVASIDGGSLCCCKGVGKLDEVDRQHHLGELPGNTAVGHVRWATHGGVTPLKPLLNKS